MTSDLRQVHCRSRQWYAYNPLYVKLEASPTKLLHAEKQSQYISVTRGYCTVTQTTIRTQSELAPQIRRVFARRAQSTSEWCVCGGGRGGGGEGGRGGGVRTMHTHDGHQNTAHMLTWWS